MLVHKHLTGHPLHIDLNGPLHIDPVLPSPGWWTNFWFTNQIAYTKDKERPKTEACHSRLVGICFNNTVQWYKNSWIFSVTIFPLTIGWMLWIPSLEITHACTHTHTSLKDNLQLLSESLHLSMVSKKSWLRPTSWNRCVLLFFIILN